MCWNLNSKYIKYKEKLQRLVYRSTAWPTMQQQLIIKTNKGHVLWWVGSAVTLLLPINPFKAKPKTILEGFIYALLLSVFRIVSIF